MTKRADRTSHVRIRPADQEIVDQIRERLHEQLAARGAEAPALSVAGIVRLGLGHYLRVVKGEVVSCTPAQAKEAAEVMLAKFAVQVLREAVGVEVKAHRHAGGGITLEFEDGHLALVHPPVGATETDAAQRFDA